jgi:hypothetical protein
LIFEPCIWISDSDLKEFVRGRMAGRYNPLWNGLLGAWAEILAGNDTSKELRALGIGDGIDARFVISPQTAYARARI